ncbi:hypothetical protein M8C21_008446 [Ambrosia artemisiifolia]|uniref:Uncharacterized protein n=1 Tax=Ambrosia artemisiifolia TaxID=4212 RepID=A0AAD5CBM8_AMBAR|nr:hypothetical protein M8C21_008446 [Ambrosia artemisiifolia]
MTAVDNSLAICFSYNKVGPVISITETCVNNCYKRQLEREKRTEGKMIQVVVLPYQNTMQLGVHHLKTGHLHSALLEEKRTRAIKISLISGDEASQKFMAPLLCPVI